MKVHFIAIGGSIMHSLAIALHEAGHEVSGSDDQIYDPAKSKLAAGGILPPQEGWHEDKVSSDLDCVILGMHAFPDNPELRKAQELGLQIYSFPEFIFQQSQHKHRISIAGSYGKTTVTSMVMHVLEGVGKKFNFLVGATVPGFTNSVRLAEDAPMIVMEADEYLASRLDPRPKFLHYHSHMVLINGISWDHINVFPTEAGYVDQFAQLLQSLAKAADVIYNQEDERLVSLIEEYTDPDTHYLHPFGVPEYRVENGSYAICLEGEWQELSLIGKHNMSNVAAAWKVCQLLGVEVETFLSHIANFTGAGARLEKIHESEELVLFKDYAHAPAKVQATVEAVRERYPKHNLIACAELHTFSSLNKSFLSHYGGSLDQADQRIVLVDPHALEKRRMPAIAAKDLKEGFGQEDLLHVQSKDELKKAVREALKGNDVLLMMSSGNFDGLDFNELL
jgi:UDP-N-acetylmuramate: L-alanyl-gamma-D-glutamyl-meso-diaminopimelate ligase